MSSALSRATASSDQFKRVFFALWPDDSVRSDIESAFNHSTFSAANKLSYSLQNLHLTLHFMGRLELTVIDELASAASSVHAPSFELVLNRFGLFADANVLWLGPEEVPDELLILHQQLQKILQASHLKIDSRAYQPHVSLLRKFRASPDLMEKADDVHWVVRKFALIESVQSAAGVIYQPLAEFSLHS